MYQVMPFQIQCYGISDIGLVRANNEDVWGQVPECNFYILADGMGGHNAGDIAARTVVDELSRWIIDSGFQGDLSEVAFSLEEAIIAVNSMIHNRGLADEELYGMGSTLCCLGFYEGRAVYAHVGDSRIYRFRDKKLEQLTEDHSLVNALITAGKITKENSKDFGRKHVVTQAVGVHRDVCPTIKYSHAQEGDLYFMCSDGLTDIVPNGDIENILCDCGNDLAAAGKRLVNMAKDKGSSDNITVVLLRIDE